jgi:hypothetical protein
MQLLSRFHNRNQCFAAIFYLFLHGTNVYPKIETVDLCEGRVSILENLRQIPVFWNLT